MATPNSMANGSAPPAGEPPAPTPAAVGTPVPSPTAILGEVVALMMAIPAYRHVFIGDLEWMVLPPIMMGQSKIYRDAKGKPVGFAAWGLLSPEAEARLDQAMPRIAPQEWRSGDRLWLINLVAPPQATDAILADLQQTAMAGKRFKYHRMVGAQRTVVEVTPAQPSASPVAQG